MMPAHSVRQQRKRNGNDIATALPSSAKDRSTDIICAVCYESMKEPYMTKCGHSFCRDCLLHTIQKMKKCPRCQTVLPNPDFIFPNLTLHEMIEKQRKESQSKMARVDGADDVSVKDILRVQDKFNLGEVSHLIDALCQRKVHLELVTEAGQNKMLLEFLSTIRNRKEDMLKKIEQEVNALREDCQLLEKRLNEPAELTRQQLAEFEQVISGLPSGASGSSADQPEDPASSIFIPSNAKLHSVLDQPRTPSFPASSSNTHTQMLPSEGDEGQISEDLNYRNPQASFIGFETNSEGFNSLSDITMSSRKTLYSRLSDRRKKIEQYRDDLEETYFDMRCRPYGGSSTLDDFAMHLSRFTRFTSARTLATLNYTPDFFNTMSIVSSIEFDKHREYFAVAGVTKKIKVYEYYSVIKDVVEVHYPVLEMIDTSKISSVVFNSYNKNMLASANYEGAVSLWDVSEGRKTNIFHEHAKRAWSLDFNKVDPSLIASGSDDATVKLWTLNTNRSVANIDAKANVCCVAFNPSSRFHLAFGSADHCVHYYDIRKTREPIRVYRGHKKAVSYTKFLSATEIVSASTDSQLRLWDTSKNETVRSFTGHQNEKNFVGLSGSSEYIVCGSENNCVYVYYKGIPSPVLSHKFHTVRSVTERDRREDDAYPEFVSAVCWRVAENPAESNILLAANSLGTIKVLELL